jgi:WD40 repeat protein
LDLFLSYHRADRQAAGTVRDLLAARGVSTFLDSENLSAGLPWPAALEDALSGAKGVVVLLGRELGGWQKREIGFALDRQVNEEKAGRDFPVIPVLLGDADLTPSFLFLNTWVDLRSGVASPEGIDAIARALTSRRSEAVGAPAIAICPYRGLRPFREEDAAFFVGREAFVARLLDNVLARNLVALIGSSGSGKSSVAQAGLVPLLRRQRPPARTWDCAVFTPGKQPLQNLASALLPLIEPGLDDKIARLEKSRELGTKLAEGRIRLGQAIRLAIEESKGTDRLLLVVDQFEELFTLTAPAQRARFLDEILAAAESSPVTLLLTLRADFYGHAIAASRELSDLLERGVINLGPMVREEVQLAIVRPAKLVGLDFEPGLVGRILDDAGDEPGNLPLLEFALTELWLPSRRQGKALSHRGYEEIGQLAGAIARRAEEEFAKLTPEQQAIAPRLLTRLVRVARPEEGGQDTRQVADTGDLSPPEQDVIRMLADAKLLITGRDSATGRPTVQVAHEALIRNWTRLREWVNEDRQFLLWRRRLTARIADWQEAGRDDGALLAKALLAEARTWRERRAEDLSPEDLSFIRAGEEVERRDQERLRSLGQSALARGLAAEVQRLIKEQPAELERALLLAVEAMRRAPSVEVSEALGEALRLLPREVMRLKHEAGVGDARFSPDFSLIATASEDKVFLWEAATGRKLLALAAGGPVGTLVFSTDGRYVATDVGSHDAVVWEVRSGAEIARVTHSGEQAPPVPPWSGSGLSKMQRLILGLGGKGSAASLCFSPQGVLATAHQEIKPVILWEIPGGREINRIRGTSGINDLAFSPDGGCLAAAGRDGHADLLDFRSVPPLRFIEQGDEVYAVAFSPDSQKLATAGGDKLVIVRDLRGRELVRLPHASEARSLRFSADGKVLATVSSDGSAKLWEVESGREVITVDKLAAGNHSFVLSASGQRLAAAGWNGVARVLDVLGGSELVRMVHQGDVTAVDFGRDEATLLTASNDKTARVWQAARGRELAKLSADDWLLAAGVAVAFSRDGAVLATSSSTARTWRTVDGSEINQLGATEYGTPLGGLPGPGSPRSVPRVVFDAAGKLLAFTSGDQVVLCDAATGQVVRSLAHASEQEGPPPASGAGTFLGGLLKSNGVGNGVMGLAMSPDGRHLASAVGAGTTRIWETATGAELYRFRHSPGQAVLAFSPDGKILARAGGDGLVRLLEVPSGRELICLAHHGAVADLAFSPAGEVLASAGEDQAARLWDSGSGRQLHELAHGAAVTRVRFSRDGHVLVTGSADGNVRAWDPANGKALVTMEHEGAVTGLALAPDGRTVAIGSRESAVCVRDLGSGLELARLQHSSPGAYAVEFSPDGRLIASSASMGGEVKLWRWRPEDLIVEACSRLTRDLSEEEWHRYIVPEEPYRQTREIPPIEATAPTPAGARPE